MSDIALPGSIEPARAGGPKLDHSVNPLTAILFLGVLTAGLLFVAYSIYVDIDATGTRVSNFLPFILLFVALMIALGFEFVNGFHDTANAVATVIYPARCRRTSPWSGPACSISSACCGRPAPSPSASSRCCRSN